MWVFAGCGVGFLVELAARRTQGTYAKYETIIDVLRKSLVLTGVGAVIGIAGSLAAGRLLTGLLFQTNASDPTTYVEVMLTLLALTTAASVTPARRAMRVDPMTALRSE